MSTDPEVQWRLSMRKEQSCEFFNDYGCSCCHCHDCGWEVRFHRGVMIQRSMTVEEIQHAYPGLIGVQDSEDTDDSFNRRADMLKTKLALWGRTR